MILIFRSWMKIGINISEMKKVSNIPKAISNPKFLTEVTLDNESVRNPIDVVTDVRKTDNPTSFIVDTIRSFQDSFNSPRSLYFSMI